MCEVALSGVRPRRGPDVVPGSAALRAGSWAPLKLYQFEIAREILEGWTRRCRVPREKLSAIVDTSGTVETRSPPSTATRPK